MKLDFHGLGTKKRPFLRQRMTSLIAARCGNHTSVMENCPTHWKVLILSSRFRSFCGRNRQLLYDLEPNSLCVSWANVLEEIDMNRPRRGARSSIYVGGSVPPIS